MISAIERDNLGTLIIFQEHLVRKTGRRAQGQIAVYHLLKPITLTAILTPLRARCYLSAVLLYAHAVQFMYVVFAKEVNIFLCVFLREK